MEKNIDQTYYNIVLKKHSGASEVWCSGTKSDWINFALQDESSCLYIKDQNFNEESLTFEEAFEALTHDYSHAEVVPELPDSPGRLYKNF